MKAIVLLLAAGSGKRFSSEIPKQYVDVLGEPLVIHTLKSLAAEPRIQAVLPVLAPGDDQFTQIVDGYEFPFALLTPISGGAERSESMVRGLMAVPAEYEWVAVHDAARATPSADVLKDVLDQALKFGAAIPGVPVVDTIKQVDGGCVVKTLNRHELTAVQTPQVARRDWFLQAVENQQDHLKDHTDDASVLEASGFKVAVSCGDRNNRKITTQHDLQWLVQRLQEQTSNQGDDKMTLRIGQGFDVHAFAENRKLMLGGVEIPSDRGLAGHSDADVLIHAICDALLGAAGLGDIGHHFPDNDPAYKGIASVRLLEAVMADLVKLKLKVVNVDATVIAQKPKLAPHIESMRTSLAQAMNIEVPQINLKATTTERLGFTGREEGMAAQAVVLLRFSEA